MGKAARAMWAIGGAVALFAALGSPGRAGRRVAHPHRGRELRARLQLAGQPAAGAQRHRRSCGGLAQGYAAGLYLPQRVATMERVYALPGPSACRCACWWMCRWASSSGLPQGASAPTYARGQQPGLIDRMSQFDGQIQPPGQGAKGRHGQSRLHAGSGLLVSVNAVRSGPPLPAMTSTMRCWASSSAPSRWTIASSGLLGTVA